jgi:hypothetical protein
LRRWSGGVKFTVITLAPARKPRALPARTLLLQCADRRDLSALKHDDVDAGVPNRARGGQDGVTREDVRRVLPRVVAAHGAVVAVDPAEVRDLDDAADDHRSLEDAIPDRGGLRMKLLLRAPLGCYHLQQFGS